MKKLLAILLLLSNAVYAQTVDPTTGTVMTTPNIIDPTQWSNVVRMTSNQLSQVEGTGGGPLPAYNTDTNTIRFSYFPYTVSQVRAIEQVLSGQNLSVSGFNYSWKIYNDLSNCCGTRGSLSVTGQLADKSGKVLESYFYDYSKLDTGATFQSISGTETFKSPYDLNTLGYVGIAWNGTDRNFWSGYYGPRVRESSITLNYSVKQSTPASNTTTTTTTTIAGVPTATDIATAAALPPPEANQPPPIQEQTNNGAPPPPGTDPAPNNPQPTNVASNAQPQPAPAGSPQPAPNGSPQPVQNGSPQPAPNGQPNNNPQQGPAPNNLANAGPAQQSGSPTPTTGPSLTTILTTIKNNEKKEQAIAASAVQAANDVAQAAVQATEQTAMSVATTSSNSSKQTAIQQVSTVQQNNVQSSSLSQGLPVLSNTQQNYSIASNQLNLVNNNVVQQVNTNNNQMSQVIAVEKNSLPTQSSNTQSTTNTQLTSTFTDFRNTEADSAVFVNNFLTNRTNPLTSIVENTTASNNTEKNEQQNTSVKSSVQSNTLAGKIDIASIAIIPVGYSSYLNTGIKDTAFYQPKEIYKNQTTVDNTRVLRQLSSDRVHEQMIELQYIRR